MDSNIFTGLVHCLSPINLMACFVGCVLGTAVGVLPGLGPAATTTMLLPLLFHLPPEGAIIMLAGVYYGASYGGSTTSILIGVPGEVSSVPAVIEGYPMTKQGKAGEALAVAAVGSFFAGTFGILMLQLMAPVLSGFALRFGPPEYLGLVVLSLTALVSFSSGLLIKAILSGILGMFLAGVGLDTTSGILRLTFGVRQLMGGLDLVPVVMGIFGIAEVFSSAEEKITSVYKGKLGKIFPRGEELKRAMAAIVRGTLLGFGLGLLPGMMPAVTSFLAYDVEKRVSRNPEAFGKGRIEGVAGPEAANNATSQAGFIPLMFFGLPTCPTLAVIFAALMIFGLKPGPLLFVQNADFVWTVIASMYVGNVILLILNLPLVGLWARLCFVPYYVMGTAILGVCIVGAFSVRNNIFDAYVCVVFGIIGYLMRKRGWPAGPLVLGLILGPMLENSLRQSYQMSGGLQLLPSMLLTRPIAIGLIGGTAGVLFLRNVLFRKKVISQETLDEVSDG